uniref:Uncharacterized protein n=1 Tax=Globodera rostochiensis TaxID=31243 RepID=A0A914H6C1_GLORO
MSDNVSTEKQQQQMKEIFICDDIWYGIFAFIHPLELGLKMALISDRLDVLVDVHFKSRKWSLGLLDVCRAIGGKGAEIAKSINSKRLPIPQGPVPNSVIGFERIWISYVDKSVIEFLQRIRRLFDSSGTNVSIPNAHEESPVWGIICQKIWPFVNDNICRFNLYECQFKRLRQFSPAILRNCPNLRSISCSTICPEFPAKDDADASFGQALAKWLITPRGDGFPKILHFDLSPNMEGLKRSFDNASEPFIFILTFLNVLSEQPFELKNTLTRERLTLRRFNKYKWLLVRCPIVRDNDKWAKWEKEAAEKRPTSAEEWAQRGV